MLVGCLRRIMRIDRAIGQDAVNVRHGGTGVGTFACRPRELVPPAGYECKALEIAAAPADRIPHQSVGSM
jgi:hypothetical protein